LLTLEFSPAAFALSMILAASLCFPLPPLPFSSLPTPNQALAVRFLAEPLVPTPRYVTIFATLAQALSFAGLSIYAILE
jgi:hypothetical protein